MRTISKYSCINCLEQKFEIATKKTKVFGFVGTDHPRTKIIINDETLEQVSQFTYLGSSISYQFSNDMEFKLAKFLQLIGTIKRIIFRKVKTETILKIYNTLFLPIFSFISFSSLSYDRSKASSKASSPHSAIQSFLLQIRVSSPFLKVIQ